MRLFNHPVLCNYYLTYRCNAKCGFCDIWEQPSPYATAENVAANLRSLKKLGVKVIDFTGGEPLLHRELPEFLAMAKDMGMITTVTTNTLLYPKHAARLKGLVDMLHFSLDSADKEKHDASRGIQCYDHLIQSIERAKELGERPDILFTVTNENAAEIEAVYQRFAIGEGLLVILNPLFAYNEVGGALSRKSLDILWEWVGKPGIYLNEAFLKLREAGGNDIKRPICRAGSSTIVISPENKLIMPCYHLQLESFSIKGDLDQLWKAEAVQEQVRQEGRHPGCQGCAINCYMEPSMAFETGPYFMRSLRSTIRYSLEKWVYSAPLQKRGDLG